MASAGVVSYTPAGEEMLFEDVLPDGYELILQRGEDFGERLQHTVEDLLSCGFESVCLSIRIPQRYLQRPS